MLKFHVAFETPFYHSCITNVTLYSVTLEVDPLNMFDQVASLHKLLFALHALDIFYLSVDAFPVFFEHLFCRSAERAFIAFDFFLVQVNHPDVML